ncbi:nucleotide sugar dehydrogenase [Candidatus Parcubacteria bacterium]|jgi:UDP-N-acetyl-D-galactosamine dehydrogenase|nr:nucleotide sugar dehydrogenase [Candidatus Parcubacteria bacterium]MBT7228758.1 nucleotide sugar dehydrogenase [Candidatus Parcubacteria bacterium]
MKSKKTKICIVGLGYVGLPLAVAFGKQEKINGFDINKKRIEELKKNIDSSKETSSKDIQRAKITFSFDPKIISQSNFIIIAVPTPIDKYKNPDLRPLLSASKLVGQNLKKGSVVVYESTVYPGCTENDCVPVLEKYSKLKFGEDFQIGYSPERINPGDKVYTIDKIVKVVSGSDKKTLELVAKTYSKIIKAGVHKASSIQVAEASKIIENTQRDVNIALMNEFKMIFDKANVNWEDTLKAAGTKWNFLKFTPGLVGGHCISVDPYYLTQKAKSLHHNPKMILAGRDINDNMAKYEAKRMIRYIRKNKIKAKKILILGATFKPDVSDTRNSKIEDFANEIKKKNYQVAIFDPFIKSTRIFGCQNIKKSEIKKYDFVVKAVNHKLFKDLTPNYEILKYIDV